MTAAEIKYHTDDLSIQDKTTILVYATTTEGKGEGGMNVRYSRHGISIVVTHFPYRKKPCLAIQEGSRITKVASFNSEETAEWFLKKFEDLLKGGMIICSE